jgi:hypothetical protein
VSEVGDDAVARSTAYSRIERARTYCVPSTPAAGS